MELADIAPPSPSPGWTIVRTARCALCRTDAKMWKQGQRDLVLPRVLGHEISGWREDTNERVAVWPASTCGQCAYCRSGTENLCPHIQILGFSADGGLADKVLVPEPSLFMLPPDLPHAVACLAEPLACCINALDQANVGATHAVLIFGGGPVGLLMGLASRARHAEPFIVDINPQRLQQSEEFRTVLEIPGNSDPGSIVFDFAVNACPSVETISNGTACLKPGGSFCVFSGLGKDDSVPAHTLNEVHYRQLHVVGAYGCTRDQFGRAIGILHEFQGTARLLIESEIGLETTALALERLLSQQGMKIIVNLES